MTNLDASGGVDARRRRRVIVIVGALASAIGPLIVHARVLLNQTHFTFDYDGYSYPLASILYRSFPAPAVFDPYTYGGTALTSNIQTAQFHPAQVILFAAEKLIGATSLSASAFEWVNLLNFMVLAVGSYFLIVKITRSVGAGVLSASLVSASGAVMAQSEHLGVIGTLAGLPWAVACAAGPLTTRSLRPWIGRTIGLTATLAYSLSAGYLPQFAAVLGCCALVVLARIVVIRTDWIERVGALVIAALLSVALNLGVVLSFALAPGTTLQVGAKPPIDVGQLASALSPNVGGLLDWPKSTWAVDPTQYFNWGGILLLPLIAAVFVARTGPLPKMLVISGLVILMACALPIVSTVASWGGPLQGVRPTNFIAPAFILITVGAGSTWAFRRTISGARYKVWLGISAILLAGIVIAKLAAPASLSMPAWILAIAMLILAAVGVFYRWLPRIAIAALIFVIVGEAFLVAGRAQFIENAAPARTAVQNLPLLDAGLLKSLQQVTGLVAANNELLGGDWNGQWSTWQIYSANGFQPTLPAQWNTAAAAVSTWHDDRRFNFGRLSEGLPQRQLAISTYVTTDADAAAILASVPGSSVMFSKYGFSVVSLDNARSIARFDSGGTTAVLAVDRVSDSVISVDVPCTATGRQVVDIVGDYDARWSGSIQGHTVSPRALASGATDWRLPAGSCGVLTLSFIDRAFEAGEIAAVAATLALALLAVGAVFWRRKPRPVSVESVGEAPSR